MPGKPKGPLHAKLLAAHAELEQFLEQLVAAFRTGDRGAADEAYAAFELALARHFGLEETQLFPELARSEPAEVAALRAEHDRIRAQVEALGIGVDLHLTRLPAIEALVATLHRHAAREDAMLYPWVDRAFTDRSRFDNFFTHGQSPASPVA